MHIDHADVGFMQDKNYLSDISNVFHVFVITIEFGCYLKVHLDQFCKEYPIQFETQIGHGVKLWLNWKWFFGKLPLHVELAKILVVHSRKKGMRLSKKLPKSKPRKKIKIFSWWLVIEKLGNWQLKIVAKNTDDLHRNWYVQKIVGVTLLQWFITKLLPRSFFGNKMIFQVAFLKNTSVAELWIHTVLLVRIDLIQFQWIN